ncbi:MAG TPA: hypothetical protein V6D09_05855 [Leptolyngbyaceae cyanobacterium]
MGCRNISGRSRVRKAWDGLQHRSKFQGRTGNERSLCGPRSQA